MQPLPEKEVTVTLTVAEVDKIMQGLGAMPYVDVFRLITKVSAQVQPQLQEPQDGK